MRRGDDRLRRGIVVRRPLRHRSARGLGTCSASGSATCSATGSATGSTLALDLAAGSVPPSSLPASTAAFRAPGTGCVAEIRPGVASTTRTHPAPDPSREGEKAYAATDASPPPPRRDGAGARATASERGPLGLRTPVGWSVLGDARPVVVRRARGHGHRERGRGAGAGRRPNGAPIPEPARRRRRLRSRRNLWGGRGAPGARRRQSPGPRSGPECRWCRAHRVRRHPPRVPCVCRRRRGARTASRADHPAVPGRIAAPGTELEIPVPVVPFPSPTPTPLRGEEQRPPSRHDPAPARASGGWRAAVGDVPSLEARRGRRPGRGRRVLRAARENGVSAPSPRVRSPRERSAPRGERRRGRPHRRSRRAPPFRRRRRCGGARPWTR